MLGAPYKTKKSLKESIGEELRYIETSWFGAEYVGNGTFPVVGPCPHTNRKWFAEVTMKDNRIAKVK